MPDSVFLCHNSADKTAVEAVANRLQNEGIEVWLDTWNLVPGERFTPKILEALKRCTVIAVFLGPLGRGPWQNEEVDSAFNSRAKEGVRIIPVLLPGATEEAAEGLLQNRTWIKFEKSTDEYDPFRRFIAGIRGVAPGPPVATIARPSAGCPYRPLVAFGVDDAEYFFGREQLTKRAVELVDGLVRAGNGARCLSIVGASGSGKSSFARAGLVHSLKSQHPEWSTVLFEPGRQPHETLADRILKLTLPAVTGSHLADEADGYVKDPRRLIRSVLGALGSDLGQGRLVILVDQFEEVFTLCESNDVRKGFIQNLINAAKEPGGKVLLLLCVRADFYENCLKIPELREVLPAQIPVGPMTTEELRAAIRNPALKAGCEIEPGLVRSLLDDCEAQPSPLPLLQLALVKLWEKRGPDGKLTEAAYENISLEQAIDAHAESVFSKLSSQRQQACLTLMMQLVEPLDGRRYTRRRLAVDALLPSDSTEGDVKATKEVEELLGLLSGQPARLITIRPEGKTAEIEIAHEAIFRGWRRLAELLDKNTEFLLWKERLNVGIDDLKRTQDSSCYLTGLLLDRAIQWEKERPSDHTQAERAYIRASIGRRWRRRIIVASAAAAVLFVIAGGVYWFNRKLGFERTMESAQKLTREKARLALVLAYHVTSHDARSRPTELLQEALQATSYPLLAHTAPFTDTAFSNDGQAVAAATQGSLLLWNPKAASGDDPLWMPDRIGEAKVFVFEGKPVHVALSSDHGLIAGGDEAGQVNIWQTTSGQKLSTTSIGACISALAFAADGKHLAIGLKNNVAVWWNVEGSKEEGRVSTQATIGAVAVQPSRASVALATWDQFVRLWIPPATTLPTDGFSHDLPTVNYVGFSQDGNRMATSVKSDKAYLWDVQTRRRVRDFAVTGQQTRFATLSRNGQRLALSSADDSITVWDAANGRRLFSFARPSVDDEKSRPSGSPIFKIEMNAGGTVLAASESSGGIRIYELELPNLRKKAWDIITHTPAADLRDCYVYLSRTACNGYSAAAKK